MLAKLALHLFYNFKTKNMKKYLFTSSFFLMILLFSNCTKTILYGYGVRNPKIETQQSITSYLISNKLFSENSYALKDTAALNKYFLSGIRSPEIQFYDKNGFLMLYRDDKKCNGQNDSLISFLDEMNVVKIDSSNNILEYITQLKTLDGKALNPEDFKYHDYYLVLYWAKWAGKVNKIKMIDWEESIKNKKNVKIKAIKVTSDYMNFWELDKKDMIKIYSRKTKIKGDKK